MPWSVVLLDEIDRYPLSAGSEGDPVSLAMQRTGEFEHNKKVIMCSTPTVDGESRIQAAWNASDQREYFVPCPLCNHFQILVFSDGTDHQIASTTGSVSAGYAATLTVGISV